jgi:hypothetical protein
MIIVGSATPTIIIGCPPIMECMMPHIAVEANASTVLKAPSIKQKIYSTFSIFTWLFQIVSFYFFKACD